MPLTVLIALDDSPISVRAARTAAHLFAGSRFLVINVATIPVPWVGATGFGAVAPVTLDWRESPTDQDDDSDEAELMARALAAEVPHPEPLVAAGDPVIEICAAADRHDADVIVVGSHDKSALRRLVDPSVAAGVVRDTYRPVLVVSGIPPTPEARSQPKGTDVADTNSQ